MPKRPMQKCEIHLPLNYLDGRRIEQEKIAGVRDELLAAFGSFATPYRKTWRYDRLGCVEILKVEILSAGDNLKKKRLKRFKDRLKKHLPQIEVLITVQSVEVI